VTVALEADEEASEEELTKPATLVLLACRLRRRAPSPRRVSPLLLQATLVALDVRESALSNARAFYAQKKAAALKTAKTIAAADGAVRSAESKAKASVAAIKVSASIRAVRSTGWL